MFILLLVSVLLTLGVMIFKIHTSVPKEVFAVISE